MVTFLYVYDTLSLGAYDDYTIPAYIKSGLKWLNEQKILE